MSTPSVAKPEVSASTIDRNKALALSGSVREMISASAAGELCFVTLLQTFTSVGAESCQAVWGVIHALHTPLMSVMNTVVRHGSGVLHNALTYGSASQIVEEAFEQTVLPTTAHERTIAQTVDCPAPLLQEENVEVKKLVPQALFSDRFCEQTGDATVLQLQVDHVEHVHPRTVSPESPCFGKIVESVKTVPQVRFSAGICEKTVDATVPRLSHMNVCTSEKLRLSLAALLQLLTPRLVSTSTGPLQVSARSWKCPWLVRLKVGTCLCVSQC